MLQLLLLVGAAFGDQSALVAAAGVESSQPNLFDGTRIMLAGSSACSGTSCSSLSRRALLHEHDVDAPDEAKDGPRAPPNPVLAATPLTQEAGTEVEVTGAITVVRTAAELYAAVSQGSRHIDLRDHIDLTVLSIDPAVEWSEPLLPEVTAATVSITGSCYSSPTAAHTANITGVALRPFHTGQCLIVTDADVFPVRSGNLWLHNIYIRVSQPVETQRDDIPELAVVAEDGQLWLSSVTMQGTGSDQSLAIDGFSKVHAENCVFADDGPQATLIQMKGTDASAAFLSCVFASSSATGPDGRQPAAVVAAQNGASVKLEDCQFESAPGRLSSQLSVDKGFIYSDISREVDDIATGNPKASTKPLDLIPPEVVFLQVDDAWVNGVRAERDLERAGRGSIVKSDDSSGLGMGPIIGIAGGALGLVLIALLIALLLRFRPHHRNQSNEPKLVQGHVVQEQYVDRSHKAGQSDNSSHHAIDTSHLSTATNSVIHGDSPNHNKQGLPGQQTLTHSPPTGVRSMLATSDATNNSAVQIPPRPPQSENPNASPAMYTAATPPMSTGELMVPTVVRAGRNASQGSAGSIEKRSGGGSQAGSTKGSVVRAGRNASGGSGEAGGGGSVIEGSGDSRVAGGDEHALVQGLQEAPPARPDGRDGRRRVVMPRRKATGSMGSGGSGGGRRGDLAQMNENFEYGDHHGHHFGLDENPAEVVRSGAEGVDERLSRIQSQLDSTGAHHLLHGLRFKKGSKSRLQGGQAVVQFATDIRTEREYAIKFFATRDAFIDEAALYSDSQNPLNKLLPRVREICDNVDGRVTDAVGEALPPCIIMEKGEALNIWSRRNKGGLDHMTALQVLHHIAERLSDLHEAGYVHRDLKQSNVMWQPRRNRWTLIDFGLVATVGEPVQIGFSLAYAAPEVVRAYRNGETTVVANAAVDAWSLGVLAVELFTNDVALDLMQGKDRVISQIVGDSPLPWEDIATAPAILKRFGLFKEVILELLERDPDARPTMVDFMRSCRQVLALTTSNH